VVVQQGDRGDHFYILTSGKVAISIDGRVVRHQGAGESFGEIALLRRVPRTATVEAVEPTEMVVLDRRVFLEAVTGVPASAAAADAVIAERMSAAPSPATIRADEEANASA
jgi:CRP-like cAMP-binding protein